MIRSLIINKLKNTLDLLPPLLMKSCTWRNYPFRIFKLFLLSLYAPDKISKFMQNKYHLAFESV